MVQRACQMFEDQPGPRAPFLGVDRFDGPLGATLDGGMEIRRRHGLREHALRTKSAWVKLFNCVPIGCDNDERHPRRSGYRANGAGELDTAGIGQPQIQDNQLWWVLEHLPERIGRV